MTNPKHINRAVAPKPLTQEERDNAAIRAFMQKRESIAHSVLAGITQRRRMSPKRAARYAVRTADAFMQELYLANEETEKPAE